MGTGLLTRLLNTDDVLISFHALQTLLVYKYGKPMETHLSAWILDHPDEFQDCIRRLYTIGIDIAPIGTQASSPFRSKPFGKVVVDRVYELNYRSVKLAREVTPKDRYILGSISSTNPDYLQPVGDMTYGELYEGYQKQALGLLEGGVDLIAVVGNHIDESVIAIKVVKDHADIPVIACTGFFAGKKGFRTLEGLEPKVAAAKLQRAKADIIGFCCGLMTKSLDTSDWYPAATTLLKELKQGTDRFLYLSPDAGLAQLINDRTIYPASPDEMALEVPSWIDVGARIISGCCGTNLEHMKRVSSIVRQMKEKDE